AFSSETKYTRIASNALTSCLCKESLWHGEGGSEGRMDKKISLVIIGVIDMPRAVDFYRSTLGLPLKFQTPTYSEFKTGGAALALQKRVEVAKEGPSFSLPTNNIKKDHEALRRKKVKFWKDLSEEPYGCHDAEGQRGQHLRDRPISAERKTEVERAWRFEKIAKLHSARPLRAQPSNR